MLAFISNHPFIATAITAVALIGFMIYVLSALIILADAYQYSLFTFLVLAFSVLVFFHFSGMVNFLSHQNHSLSSIENLVQNNFFWLFSLFFISYLPCLYCRLHWHRLAFAGKSCFFALLAWQSFILALAFLV